MSAKQMFCFAKVCRICVGNHDVFLTLHDLDSNNIYLWNKLIRVIPEFDEDNENLPIEICITCSKDLETAYRFKEKCLKSQKILKDYAIQLKPRNEDNEDIEIQRNEEEIQNARMIEREIEEFDENQELNDDEPENYDEDNREEIEDNIGSEEEEDIANENEENVETNSNIEESELQPTRPLYEENQDDDYCDEIEEIIPNEEAGHSESNLNETDNELRPKRSKSRILYEESDDSDFENYDCETSADRTPVKTSADLTPGTSQTRVRCTICDKSISTSANLKRHMLSHLNQKLPYCPICNKSFTAKTYFFEHMKKHNKTHWKQKCHVCKKRFTTKTNLKNHMLIHLNLKPFKCEFCQKSFRYLQNKKTHILRKLCIARTNSSRINTDIKIVDENIDVSYKNTDNVCKFCNKKFANQRDYGDHIGVHTGEKRYECTRCKQKFRFISGYRLHMRKHGVRIQESIVKRSKLVGRKSRKITCSICSRICKNLRSLKIHRAKAHAQEISSIKSDDITQNGVETNLQDDGYHKCRYCNKSFRILKAMLEHEDIHTGERRYKCEICKFQFRFHSNLTRHMRKLHSNDNEVNKHISDDLNDTAVDDTTIQDDGFNCQFCNKSFKRQVEFFNHLDAHTKENQQKSLNAYREMPSELQGEGLVCQFCNKRFKKKYILLDHIGIHTGEKRHKCTVCNKAFRFRSNWHIHSRTHQNDLDNETATIVDNTIIKNGRLICQFCNKKFTREDLLLDHIGVHTGEKRHKCTNCNQSFRFSSSYYLHLRKFHNNIEDLTCQLCNKTFTYRLNYYKHLRQYHSDDEKVEIGTITKTVIDATQDHICQFCDKRFRYKPNYDKHLRSHHSNDLNIENNSVDRTCQFCSKSFKKTHEYLDHLGVHTGEKRHKCSICNQLFRFTSQYCTHLRKHKLESINNAASNNRLILKIRRYSCELCDMKCFTQRSLNIHKARKHFVFSKKKSSKVKRSIKPATKVATKQNGTLINKNYYCQFCNKDFSRLRNMLDHEGVHTGEKRYQCNICHLRVRFCSAFSRHQRQHHDE